jgi:beta-lactamase regulating signal transducer with metallopeptidase domain
MIASGLQPWAQLVVERVVNAIPGGLLIALLTWIWLRLVGKQNSGTRFAVWFCSLLAVAGLPFVLSLERAGTATPAVRSEIVLPGIWGVVLFAIWILIAVLAAIRIVAGLWKLRQLRRHSVALAPSNLPPSAQDLIAQFQSARQVEVCSSSAVTVPTAIGFFRPAILIPEWLLPDLSAEELEVILLHEFAHLQRWDDWTNLAQKLVRTVFFFHPAVWWIEKRLTLEREMACDDVVLSKTDSPQAYAECLVSLAEKNFVRRGLALAQAVVSHARETSLRLARILDGDRANSPRVFKPALGLLTVLVATCLIAIPHAPTVIAFENASAPPAVVSATNTAPHLMPAAIIPAAVRTGAALPNAAATGRSPRTSDMSRAAKFSGAVAPKQEPIDVRAVMARASEQPEMPVPQLVFVMQTTQYDGSGSAIVSLSVWRVTFDNTNPQTARPEVIVRLL